MKLSYWWLALLMTLIFGIAAGAVPVPKDKEKEHEGQNLDSGSFGVFQSNHRVGTETFSIYQTSNGIVINSEFKTENAPIQAVQTSEMQLTGTGDIRRYDWKELSPDKAESVVLPNSEFLNQKWSDGANEKQGEQPYLLSASTSILDDYFFIHREVLAWKFRGSACKMEKGQLLCPLKQRTQFGTLNPRQHSSAPLTAEYLGREKVSLKNGEKELNKLELKNDAGTWQIWLDDEFKVIRMSILGENTEVVRD